MICTFCRETYMQDGWEGLCDRRCYYGLVSLIEEYGNGNSEPDYRVVEYFTTYPVPSHSFACLKPLKFTKTE